MRSKITLAAVALALLLSAGCSESVQQRLQRAGIAVSNSKFEHAIDLADSILRQQPNLYDAQRIKAVAQMGLLRMDDSQRTLNQMLKDHPENPDAHREMLNWCVLRIRAALGQTSFYRLGSDGSIVTDDALNTKADDARQTGMDQADWLAGQGKDPAEMKAFRAEAEYLRVRLLELDLVKMHRYLDLLKTTLTRGDNTGAGQATGGEAVKQQETRIEATLNEMEQRLDAAVDGDPRLFKADDIYVRTLADREHWNRLWALTQSLAKEKDLPEGLGQTLVTALMQVPDQVVPVAQRTETGWKILNNVAPSRQKTPAWWVSSARLDIVSHHPELAGPLLEQVLNKNPGDIDARYLLARSFFDQKKYKEARGILDRLVVDSHNAPKAQFLYGLTLEAQGDVAAAKEAVRTALDQEPANPDYLVEMINLTKQTSPDAIQNDLDKLLREHPDDPRGIRFALQRDRSLGQRQDIVALMARVEKIRPRGDDDLEILIDGYNYLLDYKSALSVAQEMADRHPDQVEPCLAVAEIMLAMGQDAKVGDYLKALREKFPNQSSLNELIGKLYLRRRLYDRAIDAYSLVVADHPSDIEARLNLAQALSSLAMSDEALENINKVLEQDPQNAEAHALAARIYQTMNQPDKAMAEIAQIDSAKINPRTSPAVLAQVLMYQKKYDEAVNVCVGAINANNNDPMLRVILAELFIRKDKIAQAEEQLIGLVRSQPDNPLGFILLSQFYAARKFYDSGIESLVKLEKLNEPFARLAQASLLSIAGKPDAAIDTLSPIYPTVIHDRKYAALLVANELARLYVAKGEFDQAAAVYDRLIQARLLAPQATLAQIILASRTDSPDASAAKLEKLLKTIAPDQKALMFQVMRQFVRLGKFDRAVAMIDSWLAQHPGDVGLHVVKGEILQKAARPADAVKAYMAALASAPDDAQTHLRLAEAYAQGFDFANAEQAYRAMARLGGGERAAALTELGQMFESLGLHKPAEAAFTELERQGKPTDPRVIYAMGVAAAAEGHADLARQRFALIPDYSTLYVPAQMRLARLEQAAGLIDQAHKRLTGLARDPNTARLVAAELLAMDIHNRQDQDIIRSCDQVLAVDNLPPQTRTAWLGLRIAIASARKDWTGVSNYLDQLGVLQPGAPRVAAARIVMAVYLHKPDAAVDLYKDHQQSLAKSPFGASLALLLNTAPPQDATLTPEMDYLLSMSKGQLDRARSAAEAMSSLPVFFRQDLLAAANRPDAGSPGVAAAFNALALADLATDTAMPALGQELAQQVIKSNPDLAPAYAMSLKALSLFQGVTPETWTQISKALPGSELALLAGCETKLEAKDPAGATADLESLLQREPKNEYLEWRLANLYMVAKQYDQAIKMNESIVAQGGPYAPQATNDAASLIADHQPARMAEAVRLVDSIPKSSISNGADLDTAGWIKHLAGQDAEALPLLCRAITSLSDRSEAHYHLGVVYQALGNKTWARYHLERAAEDDSNPDYMPKVKQALAQLGP